MRFIFVLVVLVSAIGCSGSGNDLPIREYHATVQPLMVENEALADKFIELAIQIKQENIPGEEVARKLESDLIPHAQGLRAKASSINLGQNELGQVHAILVNAWTLRAAAYKQMVEAYEQSDTQIFDNALSNNNNSKSSEETYFSEVNRYFATKGLRLIQFPKGG